MRSLFGRVLGPRSTASEPDLHARLPIWPGWIGAVLLVAVNLLQIGLNWWIMREAADDTREPSSTGAGALRVLALVGANGLQTGLTWWVYHSSTRAPGPRPR